MKSFGEKHQHIFRKTSARFHKNISMFFILIDEVFSPSEKKLFSTFRIHSFFLPLRDKKTEYYDTINDRIRQSNCHIRR